MIKVTCPLCGTENTTVMKDGRLYNHASGHKEWVRTHFCGGSGLTVQGATAVQGAITDLARESVVLRQIETGYIITMAVEAGSAVGMTQEGLDDAAEGAHQMADGVDHSIDIMRGAEKSDHVDMEVDESIPRANLIDDLGKVRPKPKDR